MLEAYNTTEAMQYKIACDGYDLIDKFDGILINEYSKKYAQTCTRVTIPNNIEEFITKAIEYRGDRTPRDIPDNLCNKYEVGMFKPKDFYGILDTNYVLFNEKVIEFWKQRNVFLEDLEFMVAVSRDKDGVCNGLGLRLLELDNAKRAFKWLFPFGQNCTFGYHLTNNEQLILCEGFQDMIAFRETGYNAIGLGSAVVTDEHKERITEDYVFCGDMDKFGMELREADNNTVYYEPQGKDPYEVFLKHGYVNIKCSTTI